MITVPAHLAAGGDTLIKTASDVDLVRETLGINS
jgi:hypothetical protein